MILAFLVLLLCLSAFFSGSETAFFSLDRAEKHKLNAENSTAAQLILRLLKQPRELLIAILFGNVLVNVLYFSIAASLAAQVRATDYAWFEPAVHVLSLFGIIIFGEIIPKVMTIVSPQMIAKLLAPPLAVWQQFSACLTGPLGALTGSGLRLLEAKFPPLGPLTNVELAEFVTLQTNSGALHQSVSNLLEDVLLLSQVRVREVMTPRVDIRCFNLEEGREAFFKFVADCRFSKIPVHKGGDLDAVNAILDVKSVLRHPSKPLTELIEKAWFIPETQTVDRLLQEILNRDAKIAIVVDEYGGTAGLVTIEDVVEEVVGDISVQRSVPLIEQVDLSNYLVRGVLSLRELNDLLDLQLTAEGVTTIAGFMAKKLGHIPVLNETIDTELASLKITRVEKFRVRQVQVTLKAKSEELTPSEQGTGEQ